MNNVIHPIRYVPHVKQVNPKKRNSGRKDGEKGEQEFSGYISFSEGDCKSKKHNKVDPDQESSDKVVKGKEDSLKANDLNGGCGTIIDLEV